MIRDEDLEGIGTVTECQAAWDAAQPLYPRPLGVTAHAWQYMTRDQLRALVSAWRAQDTTAPRPIPTRSAPMVAECRRAVDELRRAGRRRSVSAVATWTGYTRETVAGYVKNGWLDLTD